MRQRLPPQLPRRLVRVQEKQVLHGLHRVELGQARQAVQADYRYRPLLRAHLQAAQRQADDIFGQLCC